MQLLRPIRLLHGLCAVVVLAVPAMAELIVQASPHSSLIKTRQLLDALDVRVLLAGGFTHAPDLQGTLSERRGVEGRPPYFFVRKIFSN